MNLNSNVELNYSMIVILTYFVILIQYIVGERFKSCHTMRPHDIICFSHNNLTLECNRMCVYLEKITLWLIRDINSLIKGTKYSGQTRTQNLSWRAPKEKSNPWQVIQMKNPTINTHYLLNYNARIKLIISITNLFKYFIVGLWSHWQLENTLNPCNLW